MPRHRLSNPTRPELSEAKYRTYESLFLELLETYPAPFCIKPTRGALTTLVVRLREAANAVLHHSASFSSPPLINVESLRVLWPKVTLSIRDESVVIAEPSAAIDLDRARVAERSVPKPLFTVSNPTPSELCAFASVFQRRATTEPFLFVGEVPSFVPPPGVAFEETPDGWMML